MLPCLHDPILRIPEILIHPDEHPLPVLFRRDLAVNELGHGLVLLRDSAGEALQ